MFKIEGEKVYLVPFEEEHLNDPKYFSWLGDYEVMKHIYRFDYLMPKKFEEVRSYVENVWKNKYCVFLAMISKENDEFVGSVKINYGTDEGFMTQVADIGIMIGEKDEWGKGFATDAIRATAHYCFKNLSMRKVTAGVMENNKGMIKVFTKLGFKIEANLRKKLLFEGEYFDHVLFGLFKNEFNNVK